MPVESATYIKDLQPDWPQGTDPESNGDDHIRMTKQVIQNTFPNLDGAVNNTPKQLNDLSGIGFATADSSNLKDMAHWNMMSPDDGGTVPVVVGTPTPEFGGTVNNFAALNYAVLINVIMPVGHILMTTNPADPSTYLGFGGWTQRPGWICGAGAITSGDGRALNMPVGADSGSLNVHTSQIAAEGPAAFTISQEGQHAHNFSVDLVNTDNGHYGDTGYGGQHYMYNGVTDQQGQHSHTVEMTLGSATANFYPPTYAVYVWERTA